MSFQDDYYGLKKSVSCISAINQFDQQIVIFSDPPQKLVFYNLKEDDQN